MSSRSLARRSCMNSAVRTLTQTRVELARTTQARAWPHSLSRTPPFGRVCVRILMNTQTQAQTLDRANGPCAAAPPLGQLYDAYAANRRFKSRRTIGTRLEPQHIRSVRSDIFDGCTLESTAERRRRSGRSGRSGRFGCGARTAQESFDCRASRKTVAYERQK